jgi:hypothetical protein
LCQVHVRDDVLLVAALAVNVIGFDGRRVADLLEADRVLPGAPELVE